MEPPGTEELLRVLRPPSESHVGGGVQYFHEFSHLWGGRKVSLEMGQSYDALGVGGEIYIQEVVLRGPAGQCSSAPA